jgi:septum formation inhibitor MinC
MVERRLQRNTSIIIASQEAISTKSPSKIERPRRTRKRAKTTHVKFETEQEDEGEEQSQSQEKLLEGENLAASIRPEDQALATETVLKPTKRKRKVQVNAIKEENKFENDKVRLEVRQEKAIKEEYIEKGEEVTSDAQSKKPRRKRKTKEEKEAEAMPLAARSVGLRILIGAHVSAAKGALLVLARADSWLEA